MQKKILIIEDETDVRSTLVDLLESVGYKPIAVQDGLHAINFLEQEIPDLVISDIMMPVIDGYQVLEHFQRLPATSNVPFIFLSAKIGSSDIRKGMINGADDYITKPFRAKDLLQSVETQLRKKERTDEKFDQVCQNISAYIPHELLTPLIPIIGYPELITEKIEEFTKEEIYEMLTKVMSAGKKLHKTIDKFIRYTDSSLRLFNKKEYEDILDKYVSSAEAIIHITCINAAAEMLREKDLEFDIEDALIKILDKDFAFIIYEVIENALKFSNPGTKIKISGKTLDKVYQVDITDRGRGMTSDQLTNIFPFTQHNRNVFQHNGNGLGLISIKNLLEFYNGWMSLSSFVNEHTKCSITIPLSEENFLGNV